MSAIGFHLSRSKDPHYPPVSHGLSVKSMTPRLGLTRIFIIVYELPKSRAIDHRDLFSLLITKQNATIGSVDSREWTLTTCSVVIVFWRLCNIMDTHCV